MSTAVVALFMLRFLVGLAEAPSFPGNARIVAAWFPTAERGTASAIFNSAQYFATVLFAPLMGWIVYSFGWQHVFIVMGVIGIIFSGIWLKVIHSPRQHPMINEAEFKHIADNGGMVDMDQDKGKGKKADGPKWDYIRQLLTNRMMLGVYLGQYCINGITYFFLTWFPVYLVQERGMTILKAGFIASLPAICGFIGGVLGGVISDYLLRKGHSLTFARKAPIIAGLLVSSSIVACNYVDVEWMVVWLHGAGILRQRRGRAGLGGGVRHFAKTDRRSERWPVQHLRQHRLDHHTDRDWLHHQLHRFVQMGAGVCRLPTHWSRCSATW